MTELYNKLNELANGVFDWDYYTMCDDKKVVQVYFDRCIEEFTYDCNGNFLEKIVYEC
jgi:hypothetical protein